MIEILLYKTLEEAEQELGKYDQHNIKINEEFNEEYHKSEYRVQCMWRQQEGGRLNEINSQKRYFVVELVALPDKYLFSASSFPFVGENGFCKNIPSLAQGVKDMVTKSSGSYPTLEVVLYTVLLPSVDETRSLNQQEREEFVKLYERE